MKRRCRTCRDEAEARDPCWAILATWPVLDSDKKLEDKTAVADHRVIRPAVPADADAQREVERAAGTRFLDVGMAHVAASEPMSTQKLAAYATAGCSWVATDQHDHVLGYAVVELIDGFAHVEQVSVKPEHQGQGLGRALISEVERWAAATGIDAITLTTFAEVPWNRPLYEHLGFRVLENDELSPGLRAVRDHEAAHGLDPELRVCMYKPIRRIPV